VLGSIPSNTVRSTPAIRYRAVPTSNAGPLARLVCRRCRCGRGCHRLLQPEQVLHTPAAVQRPRNLSTRSFGMGVRRSSFTASTRAMEQSFSNYLTALPHPADPCHHAVRVFRLPFTLSWSTKSLLVAEPRLPVRRIFLRRLRRKQPAATDFPCCFLFRTDRTLMLGAGRVGVVAQLAHQLHRPRAGEKAALAMVADAPQLFARPALTLVNSRVSSRKTVSAGLWYAMGGGLRARGSTPRQYIHRPAHGLSTCRPLVLIMLAHRL
jgi:hypothetical protein